MTTLREPPAPHDHAAALAQYERRAPYYDAELAVFEPFRRLAIERLGLCAGQSVLDAGCGTGLSFAALRERVGTGGRVVGIEQSPAMLARAHAVVQRHGWHNVTLIEGCAEAADIGVSADAALFHFTHDILHAPLALDNVLRHLRGGALVVACGLQWASVWAWPLNLFVLGAALHSTSSLDGLQQPWLALAERLDALRLTTELAGAIYVASGSVGARV